MWHLHNILLFKCLFRKQTKKAKTNFAPSMSREKIIFQFCSTCVKIRFSSHHLSIAAKKVFWWHHESLLKPLLIKSKISFFSSVLNSEAFLKKNMSQGVATAKSELSNNLLVVVAQSIWWKFLMTLYKFRVLTYQLLCCSWCKATLNPNIDPSWPSCRM